MSSVESSRSSSQPRVVVSFRVPPSLLSSARATAAERGDNLSRVVVRALELYVRRSQ